MHNNSLPSNWSWVKLGDVVESFKRGPFGSSIKKSFFVSRGYKVYEQKNAIYNTIDLGNYYIDDKKFQDLEDFEVVPGDFIVSCSGTIGKIYRLPPNAPRGIINQALLRIRLKENEIFVKYFLEFFKSYLFQKQMLVETRGSAMLNITGVKELKQIPIPLPPFPEQKKIVAKIEELFSELDNGIEQLKKGKEQIKVYKQSVLSHAFSGRLVGENQRSKVKSQNEMLKVAEAEVEYKTNVLPNGWKELKFIDFCKLQRGYDLPLKKINKGKYPVVTSGGIGGYHNEYKANGPCLITGRSGSVGNINYIDVEKYWPHNTVLYVKDFCGNLPKFIYYYFQQFNFKKFSSSTAVPTLDRKKLYNEQVKLPPLTQQHKIVKEIESRFSVADKLEQTIDESISKANTLRQSILKNAFEGKLE